jgi:alpha-mannosidase
VQRPDAVDVRHVAAGPVRGELVITRRYGWPRDLTADATGRSDIAVPTDVVSTLELRAGEPFVRVRIEFDNGSRDHRVRWHLPLPAPVESSAADGQFAVVERGLTPEGGHGEVPLPTFPAVGFVSVAGCSVLLDQVTEYEVVEGRELALTLLRSFGLISRNANPYREDPAGPEVQVPAAQLPGRRTFGFALLPHAGGWAEGGTIAAAEAYRHPFAVIRGTGPTGGSGDDVPGLRLEGVGVALSALRRRDDHLELRIVNESRAPRRATVHLPLASARDADLLGRPGADLATADDRLELDLGPWEIRTVQLRPRTPTPGAASSAPSTGPA